MTPQSDMLIVAGMITLMWAGGFGAVCGVVAYQKNRDVIRWVMAGLGFGLFAMIIILVLKEPERKHRPHHCDPWPEETFITAEDVERELDLRKVG